MSQAFMDLMRKNRSYRRFYQAKPIPMETLRLLIDIVRLAPSGANLQPLKYILSADPEMNARIFPSLAWAGYLKDWPGPKEGERPTGYVVILGDKEVAPNAGFDPGIAAQSILLGAVSEDLGGCMIGSIKREELRQTLQIPEQYDILLVIALGEPCEKVVLEDLDAGGSIQYYRDDSDTHHVPKRSQDDIVLRAIG